MLTTCGTDDRTARTTATGDPLTEVLLDGIEPLDPLSKQCPDDVPCRVQDPELWFADSPADLERAKAYCEDCPARLACLTGALERREPWGVWGGQIFERGVVIAEGIWPNTAHERGEGINVLTGADAPAPYGGAAVHDSKVWLRPA